jgi:site-specific recombinase XerD
VLADYEMYLSRLPISSHTRRNYLLRVKRFMAWLEECPEGAKALTDPMDRDYAVREFKSWLLQRNRSANTVNSSLAALDNYFLYKGLGLANVKRLDLPKLAPKALSNDEQRRFLKAIANCKSIRNQIIATIMVNTGLRISEVGQLNISDVVLTARKHELTVRCGKNNKRRIVPMNKDVADALQHYLVGKRTADSESPLFTNQQGARLSLQSIDHLIRKLGKSAGVELSSHSLRHTFITRLIRAGVDLVTVSELSGHSRLETVRRYSLPSQEVMIAAVERLSVNYATASR